MAVTTETVVVTDEATLIAENTSSQTSSPADYTAWSYVAKNVTPTQGSIYTDGSDTVDDQAFPWEASDGRVLTFTLEPGEAYYGLAPGADQTLKVQRQGR